MSSSSYSTPPVSRAEIGWLLFAVLAGAVLRLGNLSQVAIEHFDEAVYASNLLFPAEQGGEYPFRQLYAPPLLPGLIEWSTIFGQMLLGDVPSWWPMLPSLIAGIATIPSAWWIVRQWSSPRAGLIAALLIAFHEFHAAFCRTALTDVLLACFVLWAVHRFWIALQTGTGRDAMIAGGVTALAWWTKYNGWQIVTPAAERNWPRLMKVWLIGAATAFALWLPVLWDCQKIGGYAKVAENHRGYVTGLSRWVENLGSGYAAFSTLSSGISLGGLVAAAAAFVTTRHLSTRRSKGQKSPQDELLSCCLLSAWFCGLLIATPMYHPYARLWVPWMIATALLISSIMPGRATTLRAPVLKFFCWSLTGTAISCSILIIAGGLIPWSRALTPVTFERRDGMLLAAHRVIAIANDRDNLFIVGASDPAIWYHLVKHQRVAIVTTSLDVISERSTQPRYVVLGPHSQMDSGLRRAFHDAEARLELVEEILIPVSSVTLLDLYSARSLAANPQLRTQSVRLFRVK